jgi:hypothetical protein
MPSQGEIESRGSHALAIGGVADEPALNIQKALVQRASRVRTRTRSRAAANARLVPDKATGLEDSARGLPVHPLPQGDGRQFLIGRLFLVQVGVQKSYDVVMAERFGPGY